MSKEHLGHFFLKNMEIITELFTILSFGKELMYCVQGVYLVQTKILSFGKELNGKEIILRKGGMFFTVHDVWIHTYHIQPGQDQSPLYCTVTVYI